MPAFEEKETGNDMYNNPVPIIGGGTVGTLAFTGASSVWLVLTAFALIAVGTAMARIVPRREG